MRGPHRAAARATGRAGARVAGKGGTLRRHAPRESQKAFNHDLSAIRAAIERANAYLKAWRILSEEGGPYRPRPQMISRTGMKSRSCRGSAQPDPTLMRLTSVSLTTFRG